MKYLVTASEMRQYDSNTIEKTGIPGMVLMERAALCAFHVIEERFGAAFPMSRKRGASCASGIPDKRISVLILAGTGNNGGDGLALARLLSEAGYDVEVWGVGDPDKASAQWKSQNKIMIHYPLEFGGKPRKEEYTIIVDALFGVGLSREITGQFKEAVQYCNNLKGFKLALDVPSGIDSDTGEVLGCAFRADVTVTFGFMKRGLAMYPGREAAGEVITAPIGINEYSFYGRKPGMFYYDEPLEELLPKRDPAGNKGTFGKVLIIAGSRNMAGAAVLAARAAYRMGAGMVKVLTAPENRQILQGTIPEALFGTYEDLDKSLEWADVAGIGPGLGQSGEALEILTRIITGSPLPLLLDADALNLLAGSGELRAKLAKRGRQGMSTVLTPHPGEMSRLTGLPMEEIKKDRAGSAMGLAQKLYAVVAAKDAGTIVCKESRPLYLNTGGNSGMATAGSGDVLSGCILGLMAQGMEAFDAACVGVYAHALAGERAVRCRGEYACMAGDIAENLGAVTGGLTVR